MNPTHILYHFPCFDGFGAALAFWLKFGDTVAGYHPVNYGQPMPDIPDGSDVFIVDFSYSRDVLKSLADRCRVTVLDHHHTAQEALAGLNEEIAASGVPGSSVVFDMDHSGAVLAWRHLFEAQEPLFFQYLEDRDLWRFKLDKSREVSAALRSHPFDFKLWEEMMAGDPDCDVLKADGVAILRYQRMIVQEQCKRMRWHTFDLASKLCAPLQVYDSHDGINSFLVPVANATTNFSEVADLLLEQHHAPFAAYYFDREDGSRQWGLRSRIDFDCSVVAKAFGGGGHKQASGFRTAGIN